MAETPRTWTLHDDAWDDMAIEVTHGPQLDAGEHVEVIEKAPVDVERERMLVDLHTAQNSLSKSRAANQLFKEEIADLDVERGRMLDLVMRLLSARLDAAPTEQSDAVEDAIVLLRERGRLPKEEL